jgi:hypothetical protein
MSTRGNALAGSLAAALEAIEIHKLASEATDPSIAGSEVLFDAGVPTHFVTRLDRNTSCRFSHERYALRETSIRTLGEAFDLTPGPRAEKSLWVPDAPFVSRLVCAACKHEEKRWRLRDSLEGSSLACPGCAQPRAIRGFDLEQRLLGRDLPPGDLSRSLADLGLREGEVFGLESEQTAPQHFVLTDSEMPDAEAHGVTLLIAGLGNIGSFLAPLTARMEPISRILLVDPDTYEPGQQLGQDIPAHAVGRPKAEVQAERVLTIRPELEVEAFVAPVERLPLGMLRGAIVASCLDSRVARLQLAARAWRVGSPFVDAAVGGGSSLLVRTNVYLSGPHAACFECAFDEHDYASLEQIFPCEAAADPDSHGSRAAHTNSEPGLSPSPTSALIEVDHG